MGRPAGGPANSGLGADSGNWTRDPVLTKNVLYH